LTRRLLSPRVRTGAIHDRVLRTFLVRTFPINFPRSPLETSPVARIERQLAVAQRITRIGSWEWDVVTGVVAWSDELYRIYGFEPRSRLITLDFFLSCLHPEDITEVRRRVGEAIERGGRFQWLERIVRADGSVRELDTIGDALCGDGRRVTSLVGTCRDVTEDRERDRQIRHYVDLVHNVQTGLSLWCPSPNGDTDAPCLLAFNPASERIAGTPLGPFLGKPFRAIVPYAAGGEIEALLAHVARERRSLDFRVERSRDPAHPTRALSIKGFPVGEQCVGLAVEDVTVQTGIALERNQLEEQLRDLSAHVEATLEDERTSIAREIHDELGQSLTALKMDIAWIVRRASGGSSPLSHDALVGKLAEMSSLTDEVIRQVRRISTELRPGVLDDLGLIAAIEWQAQDFEERTGTPCVVRSNANDAAIERPLATAVFRILQESLTNVTRHARADHVEVRIDIDDQELSLEVCDDGVGITPEDAASPKSLGLLGIRERAHRFGGTVTIGPGEPRGTIVSLRVPRGGGGGR
jgi:PAS domain S-box-containing protein